MTDKELQRLILDTGHALHLEPDQLRFLHLAINMAYNKGHIDGALEVANKTKEAEKTFQEKHEEARMKR